jgi:hypothetical protein
VEVLQFPQTLSGETVSPGFVLIPFLKKFATIFVGAGSPKYSTPTDNPKNPPPPHEKINNYIEFNNKTRIVVRDYSLGGGGLSRLLVGGKIGRRTRPYYILLNRDHAALSQKNAIATPTFLRYKGQVRQAIAAIRQNLQKPAPKTVALI